MIAHERERLATTPLFGSADAHKIAQELGAQFELEGSASKQGGAGWPVNHRWPNGLRIDLREFVELEGIFRTLQTWGVTASVSNIVTAIGPVYEAMIHGRSARAKTPQAAVWIAACEVGLRPNSLRPVKVYEPPEPEPEVACETLEMMIKAAHDLIDIEHVPKVAAAAEPPVTEG